MSEATRRAGPDRQRRWVGYAVFGGGGLLGVLVIVYIATMLFGLVSGEEFCPGRFARRSFAYYELPLIGLQVSPIGRTDRTNALERYIQDKKWIPPNKDAQARWDLVHAARGAVVVFEGDAAILCAYLDAGSERGELYWKKWSEDHPKLAAVLWPVVARLAGQQLYLLVPELFELAQSAREPEVFRRELDQALAREYRRLAAIHEQLGFKERAKELAREARRFAASGSELAAEASPE